MEHLQHAPKGPSCNLTNYLDLFVFVQLPNEGLKIANWVRYR
jgi:hypothetical protein